MQTRSLIRTTFLLLALSVGVEAAAVAWADLSPQERHVLMPFADQWSSLPEETRENLRRGAVRWVAMTPGERRHVESRFNQWRDLPPERRAEIRQRYEQFRSFSPAQQRALRRLHQRFQSLPPERRAEFRRRFESMSPGERRAFLQGMNVERESLQRDRRGDLRMPPQMVARFRVVARDLSESARASLRQRVTAMDMAQREALLIDLERMSAQQRESFLTGED